jgi:arylsulfatase A-like enzyme
MRDLKRIILITIDCLRADEIGEGVMPFLDELASQGVLFSTVVTAADTTASSHASLLTSVYPPSHSVSRLARRFQVTQPTLAETLKPHGYNTVAAVGVEYLSSSFGLSRGFDTYLNTSSFDVFFHQATRWDITSRIAFSIRRRLFSMDHYWRTGDKINQQVLAWFSSNSKAPFMAWIHYFDAHEYQSQSDYESRLRFVDSQIAQLSESLTRSGTTEDSLFAVTSDHAEAFAEHGQTGHKAAGLYDETIVVPLILYAPAALPARRVDYQVRTIDVAPTILDLCAVDKPTEWYGDSLLPLVAGHEIGHRDALCHSYPTSSGTRCIRTGDWKYIHYHDRADALFDLGQDPSERWNLIADKARKSVLTELKARIFDIENGISGAREDVSGEDTAMILEMLRDLGYVD